ncbi:nucleotide pyrophosphohydrolase [Brevibacillus ruminantium]|uniref:Nucleotide pyrophosphohydrolase n=1 Tax=Brevibacillus ruminantium TaxID=2950604 RepID=A0ABY4WJM8_9BACL|nr:nucleotide pyrophosphohydrolase [Brevibacillus ruminantium]USG67341.1 nucleotide pyrophosphohydrolase [Brevibacillus ruminantium]
MDERTTISDLKLRVQKFCEDRDWDQFHNAKDLAIGIITESSELLEHFRFKSKEEMEGYFVDGHKREEISEELADVLFFVLRFAQMFNIDITQELIKKIEKNNQRYPVEKCKGANKKYSEL